jgi:hypothetical protein
MSQRPIMDWESQEPFKDNVVWWTRLDGRYQIEVQRKGEREGTLFIWDREQGDEAPPAFGKVVNFAYGAIFGPDVDDVGYWQQIALDFADGNVHRHLGEV